MAGEQKYEDPDNVAYTLYLEKEIRSLKRKVASRDLTIDELTKANSDLGESYNSLSKANMELQASINRARGDLDDLHETIQQQHLFTDRLHSKFDDLAALAETSGVEGHKIQSIRYRICR